MALANEFNQIKDQVKVSNDEFKALTKYLNSLNSKQAQHISIWRTSQKTGLSRQVVYEVLTKAAAFGILKVKFEIWHPKTRVKIAEFEDRTKISSPIEVDDEQIHFSAEDIILIFSMET